MIEIIPAIMPKSFEDLNEDLSLVSGLVSHVQIDVMDGVFVPSRSWPYVKNDDTKKSGIADPDFAQIVKEEGGFPLWEELDFEVDLMVSNPRVAVPEWIAAGAKRIIVHVESMSEPKAILQEIKSTLPSIDSFLYTEIGIALNPETPNEVVEPLIVAELVDFVQFMGIQKIGFQGQPFDERVLEKISSLRAAHPDVTISVDGSVNMETAPRLVEAGANRLVIGSAIFESENIPEAIDEFFNLVS